MENKQPSWAELNSLGCVSHLRPTVMMKDRRRHFLFALLMASATVGLIVYYLSLHGPHTHDPALLQQQWLVAEVLIAADVLLAAYVLFLLVKTSSFDDASLLVIESELVSNQDCNVLLRLRPKKNLRINEIKIGMFGDQLTMPDYDSMVFERPVFNNWKSAAMHLDFVGKNNFDIEQTLKFPSSSFLTTNGTTGVHTQWFLRVHVYVEGAPDYLCAFPLYVLRGG